MARGERSDDAGELTRTAARFAAWRRSRKRGEPIPSPLWDAAVALAGRWGVSRTARTLGVGYYSLGERLSAWLAKRAPLAAASAASLAFVELAPVAPPASPAPSTPSPAGDVRCVVEYQDASGARLRVELPALAACDLPALVRAMRESP